MAGAPSHLELFDNKPQLAKYDGTLPPAELLKGYRAAFINPNSKLLGPKFKFAKHGQCGAELSELLPHTGEGRRRHRHREVDGDRRVQPRARPDPDEHRLAAVRPAEPGRLDTLRPGQRVAGPARLRRVQLRQQRARAAAIRNWGSGFLPTVYQGVQFRSGGDPVLYLSNPHGVDDELQRDSLDAIKQLNQHAPRRRRRSRRSPRGSTRSRWRTACRPARRS